MNALSGEDMRLDQLVERPQRGRSGADMIGHGRHDLDPFARILLALLTDVLTKLINLWAASRIDELMPWAWPRAQSSTARVAA